jgi:regulator of extracellular matrix RemA (YlzA/DUF370 family)
VVIKEYAVFSNKTKIRVRTTTMIAVGDKHFLESDDIVEILHPVDSRADMIVHNAAGNGRLINATGGPRVASIIKLKSRYVVLSALEVKTLKSKMKRTVLCAGSRNRVRLSPKHKKTPACEAKSSDIGDRRIEPDRRNLSYSCHIPERRSGTERRRKS